MLNLITPIIKFSFHCKGRKWRMDAIEMKKKDTSYYRVRVSATKHIELYFHTKEWKQSKGQILENNFLQLIGKEIVKHKYIIYD